MTVRQIAKLPAGALIRRRVHRTDDAYGQVTAASDGFFIEIARESDWLYGHRLPRRHRVGRNRLTLGGGAKDGSREFLAAQKRSACEWHLHEGHELVARIEKAK